MILIRLQEKGRDMLYSIADRMQALPFSAIRKVMEKANEMQKAGEDIIHLELGRPDFDTPDFIKDACNRSLQQGHVFYTSNYGIAELRQAVAEKMRRENDVPCDAAEVLITAGVGEAVYALLAVLLNPGDELLIPNPVWLNYMHITRFFGALPVGYHLREENDYQLDAAEIAARINPQTKAIVLITPNNPTGGVLERETLEQISALAKKHNLLVIADEIYEKIIFDGRQHISIASLPGMRERTVTLNGFSKAYSMTGWRIGYMVAPRDIISAAVRIHQGVANCAVAFVQQAAVAALQNGAAAISEMAAEYQRRRDYAVAAINQIEGLSCLKPKGSFYIFVNAVRLGRPSLDLAAHYLEQGRVALVPGSAFGDAGEGYLRLSFSNSYENIVEACGRIAQATGMLKAAGD